MAPPQYRSRLHLLPARAAPRLVVVQRKRSKLFHILVIDTRNRAVVEGSWFRGKLYPKRSDVASRRPEMIERSGFILTTLGQSRGLHEQARTMQHRADNA